MIQAYTGIVKFNILKKQCYTLQLLWKKHCLVNTHMGKKLRSSQSFNFKMQLPTKNNEIDFTYMELLISAVKKLVIKDVVLYADNKINATKKVISKN